MLIFVLFISLVQSLCPEGQVIINENCVLNDLQPLPVGLLYDGS